MYLFGSLRCADDCFSMQVVDYEPFATEHCFHTVVVPRLRSSARNVVVYSKQLVGEDSVSCAHDTLMSGTLFWGSRFGDTSRSICVLKFVIEALRLDRWRRIMARIKWWPAHLRTQPGLFWFGSFNETWRDLHLNGKPQSWSELLGNEPMNVNLVKAVECELDVVMNANDNCSMVDALNVVKRFVSETSSVLFR